MQSGQLSRSYEDRGFIAHYFYPVCLVQSFTPCPMRAVEEYLCDCDAFHSIVVTDRVKWLKASKLKYRLNITVNAPAREDDGDDDQPTTYVLTIEFKDKDGALAYQLIWA